MVYSITNTVRSNNCSLNENSHTDNNYLFYQYFLLIYFGYIEKIYNCLRAMTNIVEINKF